jgi:hypothetical protein
VLIEVPFHFLACLRVTPGRAPTDFALFRIAMGDYPQEKLLWIVVESLKSLRLLFQDTARILLQKKIR